MQNKDLGRLEQVDVRTIWTSEASDFTPWLAMQENLDVLGETIGLNLETKSVEEPVGTLRADIVCIERNSDSIVLIENQLDRTNHSHLGQLLTYSAGLQAVTVIWLATEIKDEHRAALDWLNAITPDSFSFFGLEIELWQIGTSPVAPRFSIVSKPNEWSRSVATVTDGSKKSESKLRQYKYSDGLMVALRSQNGPVSGHKKPQSRRWLSFGIGRKGFSLMAIPNTREGHVRVQLYITGSEASDRLRLLEAKKNEVEQELGYELEWGDQDPNSRDCSIAYYLRDTDPDDESDWQRQHNWIATNLNAMHRVFMDHVKHL